jgi:3-oxoacyl-[acyl-carrier protein] reductase
MSSESNQPKLVALVTGGATGIGAACCRILAQAGFRVGIHYNSSSAAAEALSAELADSFTVGADVSTDAGVDALVEALKDKGSLAVLVNNAGLALDAPLFSAKIEDFDKTVATNMRSVWLVTKKLSRLMIRRKEGRIINISSVVGSTGNPTQTAYGMTKAAIDNFTKSAAMELAGYNILVNSVAPGFIQTRMTSDLSPEVQAGILGRIPLGRMGTPEEVAKAVRFLAVDASYCTGTVIHVNGGMYGG